MWITISSELRNRKKKLLKRHFFDLFNRFSSDDRTRSFSYVWKRLRRFGWSKFAECQCERAEVIKISNGLGCFFEGSKQVYEKFNMSYFQKTPLMILEEGSKGTYQQSPAWETRDLTASSSTVIWSLVNFSCEFLRGRYLKWSSNYEILPYELKDPIRNWRNRKPLFHICKKRWKKGEKTISSFLEALMRKRGKICEFTMILILV